MSSSGTLTPGGNSPLFCSTGPPSPVEGALSRATGLPVDLGEAPLYRAFLYRERPVAINPAFDPGAIDDPSRYDGDQSDSGSSTMSVPSTNPGHQLATSGFEPIVSQATLSELEKIEARLGVLEKEEEMRNAARTNVLMIRREHDGHIAMKRKREDDEFRATTENAEEEEEGLRRKMKKLKRESMGLFVFSSKNSPETEPSPMTAPAEPQTWASVNLPARSTPLAHSAQPTQTPQNSHLPPSTQPLPYAGDSRLTGTARRRRSMSPVTGTNGVRQRSYKIKNRAQYDTRHGPADGYDNIGRPLWKRPSDGVLVYLSCPFTDCRKSDFRSIHGLTVHLTRIHKDRSARGHSQMVETFGTNTPNSAHLIRVRTQQPPPPPAAENLVIKNYEPAINNTSHASIQNNTQSNNTTPNPVPNHTQDPAPNHTQDPAPNHTQDPVQARPQDQETGYYQNDLVYSDTDDDEETPQVKVESDVQGDENLPAGSPKQVDTDGHVEPSISATLPRID